MNDAKQITPEGQMTIELRDRREQMTIEWREANITDHREVNDHQVTPPKSSPTDSMYIRLLFYKFSLIKDCVGFTQYFVNINTCRKQCNRKTVVSLT